ncbi:MAG: hypothetical protein ACRDD7_01815 [Peptostreptococcaceae bacterium]
MEILKKITTVVLSIIVFGGPQLHAVDAIEIPNETKLNIFEEVEL